MAMAFICVIVGTGGPGGTGGNGGNGGHSGNVTLASTRPESFMAFLVDVEGGYGGGPGSAGLPGDGGT